MNEYKKQIVAENYLCFAASLEMVLHDRWNLEVTQYEIAESLGVFVPQDFELAVKNKFICNDVRELGIHLDASQVNLLFKKYKLNVQTEYIPACRINEALFEDTVLSYLKHDINIICAYSYGFLYNIKKLYNVGHTSLICDVTKLGIKIYDPGPAKSGFKEVDEFLLYDAIRAHEGGILLIGDKKTIV